MALSDHFREVRARFLRVTCYLVVAIAVALVMFEPLFDLVLEPYLDAAEMLGGEVDTKAVIMGIGQPLLLQLKLSAAAAVVVTAPLWLWELWRFLLPALHRNERRWSRVFAVIAGPLFLLGVAMGYYVMPVGIRVLLGFTNANLESLVDFPNYFSFFVRTLLVFGISLEIPLFVVMLNLAGVLRGSTLGRYRSMIVIGTFVFAAVATPTTDPFGMLLLGVPMLLLFFVAEGIARLVDRSRDRKAGSLATLSDDEASPL